MASKLPTLTEISRDFLTCAICLEPYKNPKQLPCLHTLCLNCLDQHIQKSTKEGKIKCPICQKETLILQGGAQTFNDNFFIASLCEVIPPEETTNVFCDICEGHKKQAVAVCTECVDRLCQTCKEYHQLSKYTRTHRILTMEEYRSGEHLNELRAHQKSFCPKHKEEELKLYCNDCQIPVCLLCTKLHHDHHKMASLSDAAETVDQALSVAIDHLVPKTQCLKIEIDARKHIISDIEENSENVITNIETWAAEMSAKIIDTKEKLTKEVTHLARMATKENEGILNGLQHHLATVESTIAYGQRISKFAKDTEKLQLHSNIKQTFNELQQQSIETKPTASEFQFEQTQIPHDLAQIRITEKPVTKIQLPFNLHAPVYSVPKPLHKAKLLHSFNCSQNNINFKGATGALAINLRGELFVTCNVVAAVHVYDRQGQLQYDFGTEELSAPLHATTDTDCNILVLDEKDEGVFVFDQNKTLKKVLRSMFLCPLWYYNKKKNVTVATNQLKEIILSCQYKRSVKILDYDGQVKRIINKETIGIKGFMPTCVTTNNRNEIIVGDESSKAVYILDHDGQKLHRYRPSGNKTLESLSGVCTDEWGNIIVADSSGHSLHLVSSKGKHMALLATVQEGLYLPVSVAISGPGELAVLQNDGEVKFYKYLEV